MKSIIPVIIVALVICGGMDEITSAAVSDGLISYWALDENGGGTAYDDPSLSYGNDGTLTNGPTWVSGKFGTSLNFDGDDDYVDCGSHSSLKPPSVVTISAWVNQNVFNYYGQIAGFAFDEGSAESGYSILSETSGYMMWLADSDGTGAYTSRNTNYTLGQWNHVVGVYNGTSFRCYVNGVAGTSVSASGNIDYDHVTTFKIGVYAAGSWWLPYTGKIDDVAVWNRALTTDEISQIYNSGSGQPISYFLGGPGVTITETLDSTAVAEGGTTDSYEVVLDNQPSGDVQISVSPGDGEIAVGNGPGGAVTLTFTTGNWDTAQTVPVEAHNDTVYEPDDDPHTTTITHSATGGGYDGVAINEVEVEVADNDLGCGSWGYLPADLYQDCYVDLRDFVEFCMEWMKEGL